MPALEGTAPSAKPLLKQNKTTIASLKAWLNDHDVDYVGRTKKADLHRAYKTAWNLADETQVEPDVAATL